jgi:hypothetical protein
MASTSTCHRGSGTSLYSENTKLRSPNTSSMLTYGHRCPEHAVFLDVALGGPTSQDKHVVCIKNPELWGRYKSGQPVPFLWSNPNLASRRAADVGSLRGAAWPRRPPGAAPRCTDAGVPSQPPPPSSRSRAARGSSATTRATEHRRCAAAVRRRRRRALVRRRSTLR